MIIKHPRLVKSLSMSSTYLLYHFNLLKFVSKPIIEFFHNLGETRDLVIFPTREKHYSKQSEQIKPTLKMYYEYMKLRKALY